MINLPSSSSVTSFCFRLLPDQDLKKELLYYAQVHHLRAATIVCAVGSIKKAHLRLANGKTTKTFEGPFEIVSLTGTVHRDGIHMHISLSDDEGQVIGGHLLEGCHIHTTAEIILLENNDLTFSRDMDPATGYAELKIKARV
jgi:predicted DNA-binding protein with PD1-like motif